MKSPRFKVSKSPKGWEIYIPASFSPTGRKNRRCFRTRELAEAHAANLRTQFNVQATGTPVLPPAQADVASRAFQQLGNLPPETLIEAVVDFLERRKAEAESVTFREACEAYVAVRSHRTSKHRSDIQRLPERFNNVAGNLVASIKPRDLEPELERLTGPMRNLVLREVRSVFTFALRRGWCSENPAQRIDMAHVPEPQVHILSSNQLRALFTTAADTDPELVPLLAIEVFGGIRPFEAEKITWECVDFEDEVLTVPAHAAKTRRARHIDMHPTLVSWLNWSCRNCIPVGQMAPDTGTPLRTRLRALRRAAGIHPWPQDCLRHTFASAALASRWRDIGQLCLELGHTSQSMLHRHYHKAMRRAEADAVLGIQPVAESKMVNMARA